ncbi:MAG: hypothetical protein R3E31_14295 [Chloroflexota bacterium]
MLHFIWRSTGRGIRPFMKGQGAPLLVNGQATWTSLHQDIDFNDDIFP